MVRKIMTGALHRAVVGSRKHDAELIVFFEVPWDSLPTVDVGRWLAMNVCAAWDVPEDDLNIYNIVRERPLLHQATGDAGTGDMRLFEVGFWHGPTYVEPERTLMLVCPPTLRRLLAAQRALPIVDATTSMPAAL